MGSSSVGKEGRSSVENESDFECDSSTRSRTQYRSGIPRVRTRTASTTPWMWRAGRKTSRMRHLRMTAVHELSKPRNTGAVPTVLDLDGANGAKWSKMEQNGAKRSKFENGRTNYVHTSISSTNYV